MNERGTAINWVRTLGWALYLACSWTWCIGMFLPVLLVRDYGVWGFVVFAVPNVVGAGAMGWVLRDGASERIVARHRGACAAFSWVTIAFHAYFLGWILTRVIPSEDSFAREAEVLPFVLALPIGAVVLLIRRGRSLTSAALTFAVSIGVWCIMWRAGFLARGPAAGGAPPRPEALLWLAPVMVFGFALCPYLDLTFHRARRSLGVMTGRAAFSVGFGVFFASMILFTLAYATFLTRPWLMYWAVMLLMTHVAVQTAFTVSVHWMEVAAGEGRDPWLGRLALLLLVLVGVAGIAFALKFDVWSVRRALWAGEIPYRCFMAFYGLVFPAYVWLVMIPTRDGHSGLGGGSGRRKLLMWAGAVGVAAPMFWMGFIERREFWLVPGLGVVSLARLALPRGDGGARRASEGSGGA